MPHSGALETNNQGRPQEIFQGGCKVILTNQLTNELVPTTCSPWKLVEFPMEPFLD
jgi:hypothetical protein